MIKNILIGILLLICTTLVIFAYIKANDAQIYKSEIYEIQEAAEISAEQARLQEEKALEVVMMAKAEADSLRNELHECQSN